MEINRTTDYAVRAVLYLALQEPGRIIPAAQIARAHSIPPIYIPKVLQALSRAGIVKTSPGRYGGVVLLIKPEKLSLLDVVQAMEGRILLNRCLLRKRECPRDVRCPVHRIWIQVRQDLEEKLGRTKISMLIAGMGRKKKE
jgi:Rrf2 family transcriptional regulator, iron-sulfur cluster assembly transcription factor